VEERDRMAGVISVFNGDNGVSKVEISTDDGKTWKQAEIVFLPEPQRNSAFANAQVMERDVGKLKRQFRIYIKPLLVSVRV
jgi:hypothetical protein